MKCNKCGTEMIQEEREIVEMMPPDEDATEGQMADYLAAEISGDIGDWAVVQTITIYICPNCHKEYS